MKIFNQALLGLIVILTTSCSKKLVVNSSYQSTPLIIDGKSSDWLDTLAFDKDSKVHYRVSNDEEYLYFLLSTGQPDIIRKISITGFTLWIDPEGKKEQRYGINYPMERMAGNRQHPGDRTNLNRPVPAEIKKILGTNDLIKLIGFDKKGEIVVTGIVNAKGINVQLTFSKLPQLFYEAKIPLELIVESPESYLQDTTKILSLGFETGMKIMQQDRGRPNGMPSGRSGRRPGGSIDRQRGMQQNTQRPGGMQNNPLKHIEFWISEVRLSR